ncbi:hypothetical protein MC885_007386, partial [Smutsia gigantea]
PRRAGPSASNLQARNSGFDPDAGRFRSPRAELGRAAKKVSIKHLLDAWPLDWFCCQGLGRNVRSSGPREFPQEAVPAQAAARDQVIRRKESLDPLLSLPSLPSPFPSFLRAASPWLHPFSSIPPTLPCSPWLFTEGPFSQRGADAEPHCLSPQ